MNIRHACRATADEWYEFPGDPDYGKPAYWVAGHATDHRLGDELIGYLTYAAQHDEALPWPVATYDLVGVLTMATAKLPRTLQQTGRRLHRFAARPEFVECTMDYHRQPERAHAEAVDRAERARVGLAEAAALADDVSVQLAEVQNLLSPLGLNVPDANDGE